MKDSKEKVLIFGVNGFVGQHLCQELDQHEYMIFGSSREATPKNDLVTEYWQSDICDFENVKEVILKASPDIIINLAGFSSVARSWKMPQETMRVNTIGPLNILEIAKDYLPQVRILFIGSSEEYAPSPLPLDEKSILSADNPYGISKIAQEQLVDLYIKHHNLKIYQTRSFSHIGIGQSDAFVVPIFCKQIAAIELSGEPGQIHVGDLSNQRDFSDVRDVVRAYRLIIESECFGEVFNIGSGRAISLKEVLDILISFCPQEIKVEVSTSFVRPLNNPIVCCDYSKIEKLLGWTPSHKLSDTLHEIYRDSLHI